MEWRQNNKGIALLPVMGMLVFIAVLVTIGIAARGTKFWAEKIYDTSGGVDGAVQAVLSFAAANGKLPTLGSQPFSNLLRNPNDKWQEPLQYICFNQMTSVRAGGACGVPSSGFAGVPNLAVNRCNDAACTTFSTSPDIKDIAFIIYSKGPNTQLQTFKKALSSGSFNYDTYFLYDTSITHTSPLPGSIPPSTLAGLNYDDIVRYVTINELQQKIGCFGTTKGQLRIVNNELPNVCASSTTYPATLYPEGGVPGYTWQLVSSPAWLTVNPATGQLFPNTSITDIAGTYPINVRLTDSQSNSAQRTYNLKVSACTWPVSNVITFKDNFPVQVIGGGNKVAIIQDADAQSVTLLTVGSGSGTGCQWYNNNMTLGQKEVMKAYVEFTLDNDTSGDSGDFGDGFTFTLLNDGSNINTTCGANGKALGYDGIAGSHLVEFDSVQDSNGDPLTNNDIRNHVAIMETNATHASNSCVQYPSQGTCQYNDTTTEWNRTNWFENGVKHNARIELDEQTLTMKVWIDCGECTPWDTINNRIGFPTPTTAPNIVKQLTGMTKSFYFGFTTSTGAHAKRAQTIKLEHFNLGIYNK